MHRLTLEVYIRNQQKWLYGNKNGETSKFISCTSVTKREDKKEQKRKEKKKKGNKITQERKK